MIRAIALTGLLLSACSGCAEEDRHCVLERGPPGTTRFRCPDGTDALIPTIVERVPKARIEGVARYFGRDENAGIKVEAQHAAYTSTTAADGSWALESVEPGPFQLSVSAPAYQTVNVKRFLVLPGTARVRPVTLHIARHMFGDGVEPPELSPRRDAVLARNQAAVLLFDVERFEVFALGTDAEARFTADGEYVYVLDRGPPGALSRWNVRQASRDVLDLDVKQWRLAGDDRSVAYTKYDPASGLDTLRVWDEARSRVSTVEQGVGGWELAAGNLVVALLGQPATGDMILFKWDIAAATGAALGRASSLPFEVAPDGRSFAFRTLSGTVGLYDGVRGQTWQLKSGVPVCTGLPLSGCSSFSPDGRRVLLRDRGKVTLRELASGHERPPLAEDYPGDPLHPPPRFSPDGSTVLLVFEDRVEVHSLRDGSTAIVIEGRPVTNVEYTPRGDGVVIAAPPAEGGEFLTWLWTTSSGLQLAAEEAGWDRNGDGTPDGATRIFSPGGDALLVAGKSLWLSDPERGFHARKLAERSRPGDDFARFSPDGERIAYLEPYRAAGADGVLHELDRGTDTSKKIAEHAAAGFRFTPAGDLVHVSRFVADAQWGWLAVRRGTQTIPLTDRALWTDRYPIVVSEEGSRVLFHEVRPDSEIRLVFIDLDEQVPIPVDTVRKPSRVDAGEEAGSSPMLTERFLLYHLAGDRPGWYASLYPQATPQGGEEVLP